MAKNNDSTGSVAEVEKAAIEAENDSTGSVAEAEEAALEVAEAAPNQNEAKTPVGLPEALAKAIEARNEVLLNRKKRS
jgi:hypothetical protein